MNIKALHLAVVITGILATIAISRANTKYACAMTYDSMGGKKMGNAINSASF
jgi:hypothetical protein